MKLEVELQSDKELRNYVKDLVKGQIQSLARKDIRLLLKEIVGDELEKWVKDELSNLLNNYLGNTDWKKEAAVEKLLTNILREKVKRILK